MPGGTVSRIWDLVGKRGVVDILLIWEVIGLTHGLRAAAKTPAALPAASRYSKRHPDPKLHSTRQGPKASATRKTSVRKDLPENSSATRGRGPEVRVARGQLGKAEPQRVECGHTVEGCCAALGLV